LVELLSSLQQQLHGLVPFFLDELSALKQLLNGLVLLSLDGLSALKQLLLPGSVGIHSLILDLLSDP